MKEIATVSAAIQCGNKKLTSKSQTPQLDASLLLGFVLGVSRQELLLNRERELTNTEAQIFSDLVSRRCTGEPIAYIVGKKSFWHDDFFVCPDVLIPKPDTEILVEKAINEIEKRLLEKNDISDRSLRIADICTGSGCIAISVLAHLADLIEKENLTMYATDISEKALVVAKKNADSILPPRVREKCILSPGNLLNIPEFDADEYFDIIVSNPPYVPSEITKDLLLDGRNEPVLALDGGVDGMDVIQQLVPQAFQKLKLAGVLLLETGEYNAIQTRQLMSSCGFVEVSTFNDLSNQPRVTRGIKPGLF